MVKLKNFSIKKLLERKENLIAKISVALLRRRDFGFSKKFQGLILVPLAPE